eukprot:gene25401-27537_t
MREAGGRKDRPDHDREIGDGCIRDERGVPIRQMFQHQVNRLVQNIDRRDPTNPSVEFDAGTQYDHGRKHNRNRSDHGPYATGAPYGPESEGKDRRVFARFAREASGQQDTGREGVGGTHRAGEKVARAHHPALLDFTDDEDQDGEAEKGACHDDRKATIGDVGEKNNESDAREHFEHQ